MVRINLTILFRSNSAGRVFALQAKSRRFKSCLRNSKVGQRSEHRSYIPVVVGSNPTFRILHPVSLMDKTRDFYSFNTGSIPVQDIIALIG